MGNMTLKGIQPARMDRASQKEREQSRAFKIRRHFIVLMIILAVMEANRARHK